MPLTIQVGLKPYVGTYELDILGDDQLTALEWRWIKKHAGYFPADFLDGIGRLDVDLSTIVTVIALVRAGKVGEHEVFTVAGKFDRLTPFSPQSFDFPQAQEVADEDVPPEEPATTPGIEQPLRSIGGSSPQTLESQVFDLRNTGAHG